MTLREMQLRDAEMWLESARAALLERWTKTAADGVAAAQARYEVARKACSAEGWSRNGSAALAEAR